MAIKNEPKIKNPLIRAVREQLEHRALWMYLLCDEAKKKGLDAKEYAPAAIKRCGLYQGANLRKKAGGGESLKGLRKTLFTKPAQWVFEMKIQRCTDDNLDIDFHYCPRQGLAEAGLLRGGDPRALRSRYVRRQRNRRKLWLRASAPRDDRKGRRYLQDTLRAQKERRGRR